jgi:hypothetical protein
MQDGSVVLPLSFVHLKNHVCLSHDVQVTGATWHAAMSIMTGVGDLIQRIRNCRTGRVLGGQTIGRSDDAVCDLHRALSDEEHGFLG